jgi:hypothetical protein
MLRISDWNRGIEERGVKQSLMMFVNQKLEPLLAVCLTTNSKNIYHEIRPLFRLKV